jgi:Lrp/AsnC family leucine-responsive transcriptional regulator
MFDRKYKFLFRLQRTRSILALIVYSRMDPIDWHILSELQADARLSMAALARKIGLSAPAAAERVRRLEDRAIIQGYRAQVCPGAVGRPVLAFVRISANGNVKDRVSALAKQLPEVLECHRGTGSDCFILKVSVADISRLEAVTDKFTAFGTLTTSIIYSSPVAGRTVDQMDDGELGSGKSEYASSARPRQTKRLNARGPGKNESSAGRDLD